MAINPKDLTIDYKSIQAMPFRDRKALMYSSFADQVNASLTPSQRASLFPSYFSKDADAAKSALSGAGSDPNLSKAEYLNRAKNAGVSNSDINKVSGTPEDKGPPKITASQFRAVESNPFLAGYVDKTRRKEKTAGSNLVSGSGTQKLLGMIASGEGGYNSSNGGTLRGNIVGSTNNTQRGGKPLTELTVAEVEKYMSLPLGHPDRLFAVGKYQLTSNGAWPGAVKFLGLKPGDKLTPEIQEKMGLYTIMEKRPAVGRYIRGESNDLLAAQKELSLEFASIPVPVDMNVGGNFRPAGASAYGSGNRAGHSVESVRDALVTARTENENEKNKKTAEEVPSSKKTMVISMGTNDWDNPKDTYKNTIEAIKAAQAKGYEVVVVPPKDGDPKFQAAHDEVMKAVNETGVKTEVIKDWSGTGGYHPPHDEAKRIADLHPGATFVGDSIANQMGTLAKDSTKIATDGLSTGKILQNIQSDQVSAIAPKSGTPQDALAIVQDVASQTAVATATEVRGSEAATGESLVSEEQSKIAKTRRQPITPELKEVLQLAAEESGVQVEVFSGGQADITQGGPRTGKERHDLGHAADIRLKVKNADGSYRYLSSKNEADREIMSKFITNSRKMGATGIGSGLGYMGESGIHIGTVVRPDIDYSNKPYGAPAGKEAVWESDQWAQQAFAEGQRQAVEFQKAGGMPALRKAREERLAKLEEEKKKLAEAQAVNDRQATAETIQPQSNVEVVEQSGAALLPESHPFSMTKAKKDRIIATQKENQISSAPPSIANPTVIAGANVATATEAPKSNTVPLGTMAQGGTINTLGDSEIVTRSPTSGEVIQRTKVAEYGAEQIKVQPLSKMSADALTPQGGRSDESSQSENAASNMQQQNPSQVASMKSSRVPSTPYTNVVSEIRRPNSTALRAAMQIRMVNTDRSDYIA
jgi:hypothetical protein